MKILVTGGAGFIGSHTCVELIQAGHEVLIYDNFCNSSQRVLERLAQIVGRDVPVVNGDIRDRRLLAEVFSRHAIDAVIHFAGLKSVGESVFDPLSYYDANVGGTVALLQAMDAAGVRTLVFSSSATVYGVPDSIPVREDAPLRPLSPYGQTKLVIENLLHTLNGTRGPAEWNWRIACLRYFNPVGAHESGLIGEAPRGIPNNLMPYVAQVAVGKRERLQVFGNDYPTADGTGVRDFIHVVDLARGHLAALSALDDLQARADACPDGVLTVNLGTGQGYSVLDLVTAFEQASGRPVPYVIQPRRPGDAAACYADTAFAERVLNWKAQFGIKRICVDAWRWQSDNPEGYDG